MSSLEVEKKLQAESFLELIGLILEAVYSTTV